MTGGIVSEPLLRLKRGLKAQLLQDILSTMQCPICQDPMSIPFMLPECGHTFCYSCIKAWLERSLTCPMCRREVPKKPVLDVKLRKIFAQIVCAITKGSPDRKSALDKFIKEQAEDYEKDMKKGQPLFCDIFSDVSEAIVDMSDGVPRCSVCHWEVHGTTCENCGRRLIRDELIAYNLMMGYGPDLMPDRSDMRGLNLGSLGIHLPSDTDTDTENDSADDPNWQPSEVDSEASADQEVSYVPEYNESSEESSNNDRTERSALSAFFTASDNSNSDSEYQNTEASSEEEEEKYSEDDDNTDHVVLLRRNEQTDGRDAAQESASETNWERDEPLNVSLRRGRRLVISEDSDDDETIDAHNNHRRFTFRNANDRLRL